MVFVFGGIAQNKLKFTLDKYSLSEQDVFDAGKKELSDIKNEKVITHFERTVEKWIHENKEPQEETEKISELLKNRTVISCDVGCGLVPVDPAERKYREAVGRVNCILAEKADTVYRVCCGIGMKLKGGEDQCGS